jgi:hypothetical protein
MILQENGRLTEGAFSLVPDCSNEKAERGMFNTHIDTALVFVVSIAMLPMKIVY